MSTHSSIDYKPNDHSSQAKLKDSNACVFGILFEILLSWLELELRLFANGIIQG